MTLTDFHSHDVTFEVNSRIHVRVYSDFPFYLSLYFVDDVPVIKESLIQHVTSYIESTRTNHNLHAFLLDYAAESPSFNGC